MIISVDKKELEHLMTMFDCYFSLYPYNMISCWHLLIGSIDITKMGNIFARFATQQYCFVTHLGEIYSLQFANIIDALNVAFVCTHSEKAVLIVTKSHRIYVFTSCFIYLINI